MAHFTRQLPIGGTFNNHTMTYKDIISELNNTHTQLVAVSKTQPMLRILDLYAQGQRVFGENYVQELVEKHAALPSDIQWHFIGHLQSNKVRYIAAFVDMIHAVDSLKLLQEIDKQAFKHNRKIKCLLQFHIANEETKTGFTLSETENTEGVEKILSSMEFIKLKNIEICGVMGMATFTDDNDQIRREFQVLKQIFDKLKHTYFVDNQHFSHISMGMSGDYRLAIAEGSTMVRIGSLLFGKRTVL